MYHSPEKHTQRKEREHKLPVRWAFVPVFCALSLFPEFFNLIYYRHIKSRMKRRVPLTSPEA